MMWVVWQPVKCKAEKGSCQGTGAKVRSAEALAEPNDASWEAGRSTREEQPQLHLCMHMLILPLRHHAHVCVWNLKLNLSLPHSSHVAVGTGGMAMGGRGWVAPSNGSRAMNRLNMSSHSAPCETNHLRRPSFCRTTISLARMRRRGRQVASTSRLR